MSGHRPIAPSTGQSSSGKASEGPQSSASRSSESTAPTSNLPEASSASGGAGVAHKRRRVPGNVSHMACSECRQARQKCDGQKPDVCSRCRKRKLTCVYEPHIKTHKDELIREIEELREDKSKLEDRNRESSEARAGLESRNRNLQESSDWLNIILETIRKDGHDKEIIARLRSGDSHQNIADWLVEQVQVQKQITITSPSSRHSLLHVVSNLEHEYQEKDGLLRARRGSSNDPEIIWTQVSQSHTLIGHLFDLYFTWVHPVHMLFSELDFKHSFRSKEGPYCSPVLVNAICAMACHLMYNEGTKTTGETVEGAESNESQQAVTLREGFLAEARRKMTPEVFYELTSVQALAVMYLVEVSSGKARKAMGYLRSAVENMAKANDDHSEESQQITLWGINTLNTACIGMTYQKLYQPDLPREVIFDAVQFDKDNDQWRYYRAVKDENELPTRPSYSILTAFWQAKLFNIINDSLNMYCGYTGRGTAEKIIRTYKNFTTWKDELPEILQRIGVDAQPLPHILNLHVQYHTAVMEHLMPLFYSNLFSDPDANELRRMIVYHARLGLEALEHSRRLYSTRYQMPLLSFCILHLGDIIVRHLPEDLPVSEVVVFCLEMLARTKAGFAVCGPLSFLFRKTAAEHEIPIPPAIDSNVSLRDAYDMDDILDACTRLAYEMPLDQTFRHIDRSIAAEWAGEWDRQVVKAGKRADRSSTSESRSAVELEAARAIAALQGTPLR